MGDFSVEAHDEIYIGEDDFEPKVVAWAEAEVHIVPEDGGVAPGLTGGAWDDA